MLRRDLDSLTSSGSDYHELVILARSEGRVEGSVAFPKLLLVKSERLAGGKRNDPESLHLVELADKRYLLQQFSDTGIQHFNLRGFAHADDYLDGTEGNTWSSVVEDIWNTMLSQLGAFPGLPSEALVDNVPEDIGLIGINAWSALDTLLEKLGCTVAYDPIDDQFQIVALGSEQPGLAEAVRGREKYRDAEPFESNATRFPETIRVYFHNHLLSYGQERDAEHVNNWAAGNHSASIDVPTGIKGAVAGTVLSLWDDLPRLHNEDNVLENASELSTRAANRANSWVNDQQMSGSRRWEVLEGMVPTVRPGSEVKVVMWRAWGPKHDGTATEIVTHPGLPKHITGGTNCPDGIVWHHPLEAESNFSPPDLSRRSFPNYPRLINVVQVHDTGEDTGADIGPNGDNLFPGRVARYVAGSLTTLEDCWIRFVDDHDNNAGDILVKNQDYFMGRLSGHETSSGSGKPIYTATSRDGNDGIFRFETTAIKSYGANVTGDIVDENGTTITAGVGLVDLLGHFGPSPKNAGGYCVRMTDNPTVTIDSTEHDAYEILSVQSYARYIFFTLTEDIGYTTADTAHVSVDDSWGAPTNGIRPPSPPPPTHVHDDQQLFGHCKYGDKGMAVYIEDENKYTIVRCGKSQDQIFRFETTAIKSYGANVTGDLVDENGTTVTASVGLVDLLGHFGPSPNNAGGYCVRMADNPTVTISSTEYDAYEIIHMEGYAQFLEFQLLEDMGETTANEALITQPDYFGPPHLALDASATKVYDPQQRFGHCKETDTGLAVYDPSDDRYYIVNCGSGGGGKVKVNEDDGLDYLEDQFMEFNSTAHYDGGDDIVIDVETEDDSGDDKLRLFVDVSAIDGWSMSSFQFLSHADDGTPTYYAPVDFVSSTYDSGDDVPVKMEIVSSELQFFIDVSAIDNWDGTSFQFFCHKGSGAPTYKAPVDMVTSTYDSGDDVTVKVQNISGDLKFFIDASSISGWDGSKTQVLTHDTSGTPTWVEYEDCP